MLNRYRFTPDTDIRQIKALPAILQLQMNRNAMMASFRWYDSLRDKTAEPQIHDRLIAIIAAAGWAAEGLRTVERNSRVFRRERLSKKKNRQTRDDCFEEGPRRDLVGLLRRVRNKYFAHWDPKIAEAAIGWVARGKIEPVFVEWNKKQNTDSFCTMAHLAVAADLFGIGSHEDTLKRAREIGRVVLRVACMIEHLVAGVLKEAGWSFSAWQEEAPAAPSEANAMNQAAEAPTRIPDDRLAEVVRRLAAAVSPRAIYLFGSHACGSPGPDSDIDLYVTLEEGRLERDDCDELAYGCLRGLFLPIELHIQSEQTFQRRGCLVGTLEHDVRSKGRLLYAA